MIGIVAKNHDRIATIVRDLGLYGTDVVRIPLRTIEYAARGAVLDTLLVDHTAADADLSGVLPCLHTTKGTVYYLVTLPIGTQP
ncbi:hypothetical protein [Mycolicibacterium komossense]|uniref:Uncharacterized protein n=1 Tax=Mycolicibacterium komossense TaxID=1779 RepID=A0ABT3C9B6_9MYCO|nr:hypothetical protein [Mycolicibacterium komossense]MCV7226072.1 hypothetical protein [Mycolicibacterium komossense]